MKELLSTTQVAQILRISRIAVLKKIYKGQIKAEKIGRNFVIPKSEVLHALGLIIGEQRKREIEKIVDRGINEFGETLKKLGKE